LTEYMNRKIYNEDDFECPANQIICFILTKTITNLNIFRYNKIRIKMNFRNSSRVFIVNHKRTTRKLGTREKRSSTASWF